MYTRIYGQQLLGKCLCVAGANQHVKHFRTFSLYEHMFATKKTKYGIIMTSQYCVYMRCVCVPHRGAAQLSGRGSPQSD